MKKEKLENLFDFLPKSNIKAGEGLDAGNYPFYTSSESQTKFLDTFQHKPGCLVFGTGGKASVHLAAKPFATSADCIVIRPKAEATIAVGYVFQYFKGNMHVLEKGFRGAGLRHLSRAYLANIYIPHPERLEDQIKVAHLLGKVEGLIAQRKGQLHQIDLLLKSVFLKMFGDPVRNEKGWEVSSLEGFCEAVIDCPHSTPQYSDVETDYFCIRSSDIVDGYLELSNAFHVTEAVYTERIARHKPGNGDIVYSREGGRLGNAARVIGDAQICLGQRMMLFKVKNDSTSEFLWALLESDQFKAKLQRLVGGGAAPRVNIKDLKKIVVAKPSPELQASFAAVVRSIDALRDHCRQSLADMKSLYRTTGQHAFKSKLDLSLVRLPAAIAAEESQPTIPMERSLLAASSQAIDLPDTELLQVALDDRARVMDLLSFWLEAYRAQLGGATFSVSSFLAAAQKRVEELHPDSDLALGAAEYDQIKSWVFAALATGRLIQDYTDTDNRVELTSVPMQG